MSDPTDVLFSTPAMLEAFSATAHVRGMLAFETALARAQARLGIIPAAAAETIAAAARIEDIDVPELMQAAISGASPAIPLARRLTELAGAEAGKYVHWGATSQDAIDTATVLQVRAGLDLILSNLDAACAACAQLANHHRRTLMPGRTLLQQALPITFGLKAARWLGMLRRQRTRLEVARAQALVVQLGGAAGTLAAYGERGLEVVEEVARELDLQAPELPWHAERDRIAAVAVELGVLAGSLAKIAGDVVLLAQTEVGEASEGDVPGKGGSSAMPQKRNPVDATEALAAARLAVGQVPVLLGAMQQEHERAVGGWQAEWVALPAMFRYTAGALDRVHSALAGLQVDARRMRSNLDLTGGAVMSESLSMALAARLGRPAAQKIVQEVAKAATRDGSDLRAAALADAKVTDTLSMDEVERALDPAAYLGSTDALIDRTLRSTAAG